MAKRLSLEETEKYLKAWREEEDEEALKQLVVCNAGLVGYFARKYMGKGLTFEELESAGYEGLVNAINKFNYVERNISSFKSYICVSIENGMRFELRKYNKHSHVLSFDQPLGQNKDGDELTIEDIIGTDSEELVDNVISEIKNDIVRDALKSLTTREQKIILLRYGLSDVYKKTQKEVAEIFECSKQKIAKEEQKALIKMRHPRNTRKLKDFLND